MDGLERVCPAGEERDGIELWLQYMDEYYVVPVLLSTLHNFLITTCGAVCCRPAIVVCGRHVE